MDPWSMDHPSGLGLWTPYFSCLKKFNPLTPRSFCVFERFSAFTRPMEFRDSIFKVTMESAAVLKHTEGSSLLETSFFVTLSFCFLELQ